VTPRAVIGIAQLGTVSSYSRGKSMALLRDKILLCHAPAGRRASTGAFNALLLCGMAAAVLAHEARAQAAPPPAAEAPSDRAKRDAEKVYQMILMHADKPRKAAAVPAPAPAQRMLRPSAAVDADTRKVVSVPGAPLQPLAAGTASPLLGEDNPALSKPASVPAPIPPGEPALAKSLPAPATSSLSSLGAVVPVPVAAPPILELVSSVTPDFPKALVRRLGSGSVVVNFEVLPDGSVGTTAIAKTSHQGLNGAAQAAVAAWRFKPISEPASGVTELRFE
jgi:TonB family protein